MNGSAVPDQSRVEATVKGAKPSDGVALRAATGAVAGADTVMVTVASFDSRAHAYALEHMEKILGAKLVGPALAEAPK